MIEIEAPDGTVVEFPDNTPDDTIKSVMAKNYPAQTPEPTVGYAEDVLKAIPGGAGRLAAGTLGLPGDVQRLARAGASWIDPQGKFFTKTSDPAQYAPSSRDVQGAIEQRTGKFYEPQTLPGKLTSAAVEFAPGALTGRSVATRLSNALAPAAGYVGGTEATKGTALEPYGGVTGAVLGAFTPGAASRLISPLPARRGIDQVDVQALRGEGIDITAGQATGRTGLQRFEARSGGGKYEDLIDQQGEQFTAAALRRMGENANRATPEVLNEAYTRIGGQFDDLAARNTIQVDQQMTDDLVQTARDYVGQLSESQRAPVVQDLMQDIVATTSKHGGVLSGDFYKSMRSRIDSIARKASVSETAEALRGIRNSLDDAMERTIAQTNPADLGGWKEARRQYRNFIAIEQAATGAGADAARGIISPAQLANAIKNKHGRRNYALGRGDLSELARSGVSVLGKPSTSGTAENLASMNLAAMLANLPMRGAARAALTRPAQRYLSNQLAGQYVRDLDPKRAGLVAALLAEQKDKREPLEITVTPR